MAETAPPAAEETPLSHDDHLHQQIEEKLRQADAGEGDALDEVLASLPPMEEEGAPAPAPANNNGSQPLVSGADLEELSAALAEGADIRGDRTPGEHYRQLAAMHRDYAQSPEQFVRNVIRDGEVDLRKVAPEIFNGQQAPAPQPQQAEQKSPLEKIDEKIFATTEDMPPERKAINNAFKAVVDSAKNTEKMLAEQQQARAAAHFQHTENVLAEFHAQRDESGNPLVPHTANDDVVRAMNRIVEERLEEGVVTTTVDDLNAVYREALWRVPSVREHAAPAENDRPAAPTAPAVAPGAPAGYQPSTGRPATPNAAPPPPPPTGAGAPAHSKTAGTVMINNHRMPEGLEPGQDIAFLMREKLSGGGGGTGRTPL